MLASVGEVPGRTVLDIGCGVGALATTLLTRGARFASYVEVSPDYLEAARTLVRARGLEHKAGFYEADFARTALPMEEADIVLLDRVVCCYPDAGRLLERAARHSAEVLVFSYPSASPLLKLFRALLNGIMALLGKDYRFFVHDPEALFAAARSAGHGCVATRTSGVWHVAHFAKPPNASKRVG